MLLPNFLNADDWQMVRQGHIYPVGFSGAVVWKSIHLLKPIIPLAPVTQIGQVALKRWPKNLELSRLHEIRLFQAAVSTIQNVPKLIGEHFIFDGHFWDMSEWMDGYPIQKTYNATQLFSAIQTMLSIHEQWRKFQLAGGGLQTESDHERKKNVVERRVRVLREVSNEFTAGKSMLQFHTSLEAKQIFNAIQPGLNAAITSLEKFLMHYKFETQICFKDIHRDHVLFFGDKVSGIIDYGAVHFDIVETDIARLFSDDDHECESACQIYNSLSSFRKLNIELIRLLCDTAAICNLAAWLLRFKNGESINSESVQNRIQKLLSIRGRFN